MAKILEQQTKSEQEKGEVSMITPCDSINSVSYIKVTFANDNLQHCYQDMDAATREWGKNIGIRYIRTIQYMRSVSSIKDLYAYPSLRLHKLIGQRAEQFAVWLNVQWRLIFTYDEYEKIIHILEVSNHYGHRNRR